MTVLHAGGKFDKSTYKVSGGLHGVGVSVVNALSEWCEVEVCRDGKVYYQKYHIGVPENKVKVIGARKTSGTKTTFMPDRKIFKNTNFNFEVVSERMRELAFLNKGLEIEITDKKTGKKNSFQYKGGLISFVEYLNEGREPLHKKPIYFKGEKEDVEIEFSLQYNDSYTEHIFTYVNNINTIEGGTHLSGFKTALTRVMNNYSDKNKLNDTKLTSDDAREGLTAVISVKLAEPQFEVYKDRAGEWRWRLRASNNRVIADSSEGYKNKQNCVHGIGLVKQEAVGAEIVYARTALMRKRKPI